MIPIVASVERKHFWQLQAEHGEFLNLTVVRNSEIGG
jgi:hypothetical protein